MRILLDSSFLRHLELVNQVSTIVQFSDQKQWKFIIPNIVLSELKTKSISKPLQDLLDDSIIISQDCVASQFTLLQNLLMGLDDGELEAICIVSLCKDQTFKNYLILTDDGAAQIKAGDLRMKSLDIVTFLFTANQQGFLTKKIVLESIKKLSDSNYRIYPELKRDLERRLN